MNKFKITSDQSQDKGMTKIMTGSFRYLNILSFTILKPVMPTLETTASFKSEIIDGGSNGKDKRGNIKIKKIINWNSNNCETA